MPALTADVVLAPLDALRRGVYAFAAPVASPLVRDRSLRVAVLGSFAVAVTFTLASTVPLALLAFGPIFLGVPHLVADLRYLVARPGLHRRPAMVMVIGGCAAVAYTRDVVWAIALAPLIAALIARAPAWRKALVAAGGGLAAFGLWKSGDWAPHVVGHAHNVIALLLWITWRPRPRVRDWVVPLLVIAGASALALGFADDAVWRLGAFFDAHGQGADWQLDRFGPDLQAPWAARLVLLFAFGQSVHYGLWLRLIPEDDRARPTPRTFRASWRALTADLGTPFVFVAIAIALVFAAWAFVDLQASNLGYLRLALFHGPLELGAIGLALAEWRRPGAAS